MLAMFNIYCIIIKKYCIIIMSKKNNLEKQQLLLPIRHHSPACSYHLKKVINSFNPDCILIEGPIDSNNLMEFMTDEETKAPFCIYSSYDSDIKYRSYYPFLDYSPEFVAIKEAFKRNINCEFIDMPFASMIENTDDEYQKISSVYDKDDLKFDINDYTKKLTQKSGLRTFQELWEREFEINGIVKTPEDFFKSVYTLGYYMRLIEQEDTETRNREYFMASNIKKAIKKYDRILVIIGSFHMEGIIAKLKENINIEEKLKKYNKKNANSYLIPYSFEDADRRNGYQSGIEFPAFYNFVYNKLEENNLNSYLDTIMYFIIKASNVDFNNNNSSISDCINAYYMAVNLSKLRGKSTAGVYELIDSLKTSFIKGDINLENKSNIDFIIKLLSGIKNGKVSSKSSVPPVIIDFRNLCKKFKIKLDNSSEVETILDIVKDDTHFQKSRFFHKIRFLDIDFCKLIKGPDYINRVNKNLAREIWKYKYKTNSESLLIDKSVYGVTIDEVCINIIKEKLDSNINSSEISKLIIETNMMGIEGFLVNNYSKIEDVILKDSNFISLCECLYNLYYLLNIVEYNTMIKKESFANDLIKKLLNTTFICAINNMDYVKDLEEEEAIKYSKHIKNIYTNILNDADLIEAFTIKINSILSNTFGSSHIYAVCLAIKYKLKGMTTEEFSNIICNFLESSDANTISYFLSGIFIISRDILFINDDIIKKIDTIVEKQDEESFLSILPNLRYAFTNLSPDEIDRLSLFLSKLHNKSKKEEINKEFEADILLDQKIFEKMREYEIFN